MKLVIQQNSSLANDPDGHAKMLAILKSRVKEFLTPEIRDAILTGQSILSQKIGAYQADPLNNCGGVADPHADPLYGQDPNPQDPNPAHHSSTWIRQYWLQQVALYNITSHSDGTCKQDIGVQGDVDDDDNPTDPGLADVAEKFQVEPAKSVWDLLNQGDKALCRLNRFSSDYIWYASKKYKPVLCDKDWMSISKKTIVSYLFNEDIID